MAKAPQAAALAALAEAEAAVAATPVTSPVGSTITHENITSIDEVTGFVIEDNTDVDNSLPAPKVVETYEVSGFLVESY